MGTRDRYQPTVLHGSHRGPMDDAADQVHCIPPLHVPSSHKARSLSPYTALPWTPVPDTEKRGPNRNMGHPDIRGERISYRVGNAVGIPCRFALLVQPADAGTDNSQQLLMVSSPTFAS